MKRLLSIVLIAVSVASAPAQTTTKGPWDVPRSYIVATLPASPLSGTVVTVTDLPSSPTDCSTGGGTKKGLCRWNGSGWDLLSGGGGSAPAGTAGALQYNTGSAFGGAAITGIVKANGTGAPTAATGSDIPNIAESQVTNLTTDLAAKVPTSTQVNGHALSDNVTVTKADVGLSNADNTSDANKPISTATQTALDIKAADAAVVHNTGDETVGGDKTFTGSVSMQAVTASSVSVQNVNSTDTLSARQVCIGVTCATEWPVNTNFQPATGPTGPLVMQEYFGLHVACSEDINPATGTNYSPNCASTTEAYPNISTAPTPASPFGTMRLWDVGVKYSQIATTSTQANWDWTKFNYWIQQARAHNMEVLYDGGASTPSWACSAGTGCAAGSVPTDTNWTNFMNALFARGVDTVTGASCTIGGTETCRPAFCQNSGDWAGKINGCIHILEPWNEPNVSGSYTGTMAQMVHLTALAKTARNNASTANVIVTTPAYAYAGANVTPTGNCSNMGTSNAPEYWICSFLQTTSSTSSEGVGAAQIGAVAFHPYPGTNLLASGAESTISNRTAGIKKAMTDNGLTACIPGGATTGCTQLMATESSWGQLPNGYSDTNEVTTGTCALTYGCPRIYPGNDTTTTAPQSTCSADTLVAYPGYGCWANDQAAWIVKWAILGWTGGNTRNMWYWWGQHDVNNAWGILFCQNTNANLGCPSANHLQPAGYAFGTVQSWLVGANVSAPVITGTLYEIEITLATGQKGRIIWDSSYGPGQSGSYTYTDTFDEQEDMYGNVTAATSPVTFGYSPILLYNSSSASGTVTIANGGTGQTTQQEAMDALAGTQSSGKYLRSDGTNTTLSTIQAGDVPTLNQNTTGTSGGLTGTPSIAVGTIDATAITGTGRFINSVAGAASAPAVSVIGAPYTGGTGTTTHPLFYLNNGAAPTAFNTNGTMFGINAPSGFAGNLIAAYVNGAAKASMSSNGDFTIGNTTYGSNAVYGATGTVVGWSQYGIGSIGGQDTGLSRSEAGVVAVGNFTAQDASGTLLSSQVKTNELTVAQLATPVNGTHTTATTGGTLAAGTYYYRVAAIDAAGNTSLASTETSKVTTGSTSTVTVVWGKVTGAAGYKVYGRTAGAELLMATITSGSTTSWTDTGSVTPSGALPASNTSGVLTLGSVASGTQCLHANSSGVVSGTGSDCGSGGGVTAVTGTSPIASSGGATPAISLVAGALPDGMTATPQSQGDNSTKVATTSYVDTGLGTKQATGSYAVTNGSNTYSAGTQDASGAAQTLPAKKGTVAALPATCTVGAEYFASDATAGQNKYLCTATNTWTQQTGGITFKTNEVNNSSQTVLDIKNGAGITVANVGAGDVTVSIANGGVTNATLATASYIKSVFSVGCPGIGATATWYLPMWGGATWTCASATTATGGMPMASAGTLKNLYCKSSAAAKNGSDGVVRVNYDASSGGTLTCTIGTGTSCSDVANTQAVAAGHYVVISVTGASAETLANLNCQMELWN